MPVRAVVPATKSEGTRATLSALPPVSAVSGFVPPFDVLDSRELSDGRVQLLAPLWYQSDLLGGRIVKVRKGFVNDKESIPWYFPLLYVWLAVKRKASRAGTIHDWLTQTHQVENLEVSRALSDAVYHEAAGVDGNSRFVRWVKWAGVRIGGARAYASGPSRFQINGNDRRRQALVVVGEERRRIGAGHGRAAVRPESESRETP